MNKLTIEYQEKFKDRLIYDPTVFDRIDRHVKIHEETRKHPLSSSAACLNVIGATSLDPNGLRSYLNSFGLEIDEVLKFPSPIDCGGCEYNDEGYAIFEWIGPKKSPINEIGGGRGHNRTSIDAFLIAKIKGKLTQIFIEWKFTEGISRKLVLGRFCGGMGVERFRRYSSVLADFRKKGKFPFKFCEEYDEKNRSSYLGLHDLSPDHFYQLLRMTILAQATTPIDIGNFRIEDYRILHLTHSHNDKINVIQPEHLKLSPGLQQYAEQPFHSVWQTILSDSERKRFFSGHWDQAISAIPNDKLRAYLLERYGNCL